ncbi:MAG: glycosyltransferase family 39 protein [Oscillatoriales cyanobacterium RM1_1_9]|nr:glycosyltransferase family 39 protein [Oscillatoriales cyanobacterium RM1_1_9]
MPELIQPHRPSQKPPHNPRLHQIELPENWIELLTIGFLGFGILVRLMQYFGNRSLWFDEISLSLNIIRRSYGDLLNPLDHNQAAPPGFLWIEKLATQVLGNNEYALRLFPLMSSLVALVCFYQLATRYSSKLTALWAIALFSSLRYTVYYATEVKQYSSDVMVAVVFSLWLINWRYQSLKMSQTILLGLAGAVAIWLSHPAIFTLGGIELVYLITAKNRRLIFYNRLPVYLTWLVSFGSLYLLTIQLVLRNEQLIESWSSRYPDSIFDLIWLLDAFGRFFYRPLGFLSISDGVAMVAFIIGCWAFFRRDRLIFCSLMAPLGATLLASYLHQYPFRERLVLFLVPGVILVIAEGINFSMKQPQRLFQVFGGLLLLILLIPPVIRSGWLIVQPEFKEEFRPVLAYVKQHKLSGDRLYIYFKGRNHFAYYGERFGYGDEDYFWDRLNSMIVVKFPQKNRLNINRNSINSWAESGLVSLSSKQCRRAHFAQLSQSNRSANRMFS